MSKVSKLIYDLAASEALNIEIEKIIGNLWDEWNRDISQAYKEAQEKEAKLWLAETENAEFYLKRIEAIYNPK